MNNLKLLNKTRNSDVVKNVRVAESFWERSKGLLGSESLPEGETLWIQGSRFVGCNSIHTFFMRYAIDAVFVDRGLKVKKIYRDLGPWRMTWPAEGAFSVFEFAAGTLGRTTVEVGDELEVVNVGD